MRTIFDDGYDEEFAKACIDECFPEFNFRLIINKNDPPDLVDDEKSVGIEVVNAIENDSAVLTDWASKFMHKKKENIPDIIIKKYTNGYRRFVYFEDEVVGTSEVKSHNSYTVLEERIVKKINSLNKNENYKKYCEKYLFVLFSDAFYFEKDFMMLMMNIKQKNKMKIFEKVFVFFNPQIILYDFNKETIESIKEVKSVKKIQEDVMHTLKREEDYNKKNYIRKK